MIGDIPGVYLKWIPDAGRQKGGFSIDSRLVTKSSCSIDLKSAAGKLMEDAQLAAGHQHEAIAAVCGAIP